jgi:hypothetical protein
MRLKIQRTTLNDYRTKKVLDRLDPTIRGLLIDTFGVDDFRVQDSSITQGVKERKS